MEVLRVILKVLKCDAIAVVLIVFGAPKFNLKSTEHVFREQETNFVLAED